MAYRTDRVRLVVLLRRKSTLSKEEFHQYWSGPHATLFTSLDIVKTNLFKYEQAHTNDSVMQQTEMAQMLGAAQSEWDGMVVFEAESYAKIFEVLQHEDYRTKVAPDEDNFLDRMGCQTLPLDLMTIVDQ
ncbi:hypothetical protein C8R46DRAFT_1278670 [Mycena filopes]|nr:hypothetical protein C8R46DRAFT_1278670 [Mycena filopes]